MPLIQRIQVSNFMNSGRVEPWRPDWVHQIFDLNGENTAMNIPNGRGKSSLVLSILSMLTGQMRTLNELRGRHFAPRKTGRFTHIRIQVLISLPGESSNDLIGMAGGDLAGSSMVIGMYGNQGDNERVSFYAYKGFLEDCKVAHVDNMRHALIDDREFLELLKTQPGVMRETSTKDWLAYLETLFDMSNLKQQYVYQMARGAEGDSNYFEAKIPGKSYAASIFYERLAPELLTDLMGSLGEEGEHGIEDTIHEKVSGLIVAKRNTVKKTQELERTKNTLDELEIVIEKAADMDAASNSYDKHKSEFASEVQAIKNLVIDDPLPGVPRNPPENMKLASALVMQGGDGQWYITDREMGQFTGEEAKAVNQRTTRNGIATIEMSNTQVIDFTCDLKGSARTKGHRSLLFSKVEALKLLGVTTNFSNEWTRETAIAAIEEAFAWVEDNGDTNPARRMAIESEALLEKAKAEQQSLLEREQKASNRRETLRTEQLTIGSQEAEFQLMKNSGIFTEVELQNPGLTGIDIQQSFEKSKDEISEHNSNVGTLKNVHKEYLKFKDENLESLQPNDLIILIESKLSEVQNNIDVNKKDIAQAKLESNNLENLVNTSDIIQKNKKNKFEEFLRLQPSLSYYKEIFGESSPINLENVVIQEFRTTSNRIVAIDKELSKIKQPLEYLAKFNRQNGNEDPATWLHNRQNKRNNLIIELDGNKNELSRCNTQREFLNKAPVAPGEMAITAQSIVRGNYEPLHSAITRMGLAFERFESVLTVFSSLLHAPVYETVAEAAQAAGKLAEHEIEFPIFVYSELEAFCKGNSLINIEEKVANIWLVGVRTRAVDCLIDPGLIDIEKEKIDTKIRTLESKIERTEAQIDELSPNSEDSTIALFAAKAVIDNLNQIFIDLNDEKSLLVSNLAHLETRSSIESVNAIRAKIAFLNNFSIQDSVESLQNDYDEAVSKYNADKDKLDKNKRVVTDLETVKDDLFNALMTAKGDEHRIVSLRRIQDYINAPILNPRYMLDADTNLSALKKKSDNLEARSKFRFELADSYVKNGNQRPSEIADAINKLNIELTTINDVLKPNNNSAIETHRDAFHINKYNAVEIDNFVNRLLKKYRDYFNDKEIAGLINDPKASEHYIVSFADEIRSTTDTNEFINSLVSLKSEFDNIESSQLSTQMRDCRITFTTAKRELSNSIDLMLVKPNLDIPEHVRIDLHRGKEDVTALHHLYNVTKSNFETNTSANITATKHLDSEWSNISEWLQKFTTRLPVNLLSMRQIFAPLRDRATNIILKSGFDINVKIADKQDIKSILDDIVSMVEKFENTSEDSFEYTSGGKVKAVKNLRREIRNNFYQKVLLDPSINVCMPSISEKALKLEKNMVSTGQGVAMALLWIVKMANYVSERELSRQGITSAQRKRLRANKTQFTFIDGAFSSLSKKELINDALNSVADTRGNFQLIITGHDENYQNNFTYFPTLIVAREVSGKHMYADSKTQRLMSPTELNLGYGTMNTMSLRSQPLDSMRRPS